MTIQEDIRKLDEKIKDTKWSGKLEIYYNTGGIVGIKLFKPEKELK